MNWKKLGKVFDPTDYKLPNKCKLFAKSPQAIVFDDFVRVYFSSTERDTNDKLLSRVLYADFTKDFKKVINISKNEVIPLGKLGCFDEHGIFPFNVLKEKDKIIAFATGWTRKKSVSADGSIGYAESMDNGETFKKYGEGPVVTSSLYEPFLIGDAFVTRFDDEIYHMWYIYGLRWIENPITKEAERVYKIAYAYSNDKINWNRDSKCIIENVIGDDECQALPTVIKYNDRYHMFFSYRSAIGFRDKKDKGYKTGYAYSYDLKNWTRNDKLAGIDLSKKGWDSEMMCYPFVFNCDEKILYAL